jgi:hypothetical protein
VRHEVVELLLPDLGGAASKPSVGGQHGRGNHKAGHGANSIGSPSEAPFGDG